MTGPEHYLEAERLLEEANYRGHQEPDVSARFVAAAHIHATLALAAATAANIRRNGAVETDCVEWEAATQPSPT